MALLTTYELLIPGGGIIRYQSDSEQIIVCDQFGNELRNLEIDEIYGFFSDMKALMDLYQHTETNNE